MKIFITIFIDIARTCTREGAAGRVYRMTLIVKEFGGYGIASHHLSAPVQYSTHNGEVVRDGRYTTEPDS